MSRLVQSCKERKTRLFYAILRKFSFDWVSVEIVRRTLNTSIIGKNRLSRTKICAFLRLPIPKFFDKKQHFRGIYRGY